MTVAQLFHDFSQKRIAIIGDVMIDAYIIGEVYRMSPEAPVPVVSLESKEQRLGGAGNVALNLKALGATPFLVSVVGDDYDGDTLKNIMKQEGLSCDGIMCSKDRRTTVKTRVLGNQQHLLRIDSEQTNPISQTEQNTLFSLLQTLIVQGIDAVIFQDYNKGVLTESGIRAMIELCAKENILTTVDPKKDNFFAYVGVDLFKPNLKELKEGLEVNFDITDKQAFENAIVTLENIIQCKNTFITLSEHGVFIKNGTETEYIEAHIRSIADVSGAGDTVISVATLALCCKLEPKLIAGLANLAGGLVCEQSGVVPISKALLMNEIEQYYGTEFPK
jgi:rfaE bifunctional protein kinase chain/domain